MPRSRILLVDDKPTNLRVLRAMLGTEHYDFVAVDSGQAALDLVSSNPHFDLILLDVAMPDLNGIEVCRRLKSDPVTQDIPIILVSALHTNDHIIHQGLKAGANGYLAKPLDETALRAWVRATLRVAGLTRRMERTPGRNTGNDRDVFQEFARLSHKVSDPLQSLCAAAELMAAERPDDSRAQQFAEEVLTHVDRVARLVTDASLRARERLST